MDEIPKERMLRNLKKQIADQWGGDGEQILRELYLSTLNGKSFPESYVGEDILTDIQNKFYYFLDAIRSECDSFVELYIMPSYDAETVSMIILDDKILYRESRKAWHFWFDSEATLISSMYAIYRVLLAKTEKNYECYTLLDADIQAVADLRIGFTEYSTDGKALWEQVVKNGWEGVVVRDPKLRFGHDALKVKQELIEDVYCTGDYEVSTSDTRMNMEYEVNGVRKKGVFANLKCFQLMDGRPVDVGDIGGGFSEYYLKTIQVMLDSGQITKQNPLVFEVKANERLDSGKLRHTSFNGKGKGIRTDKPWNQCVMKG